jgi:hypothetical protein
MVSPRYNLVHVHLITRELELIDHSTSYAHIALDAETELPAEGVWVEKGFGVGVAWLGSFGISGQETRAMERCCSSHLNWGGVGWER